MGVRRVSLVAAAPCELCAALPDRRVPVSALAFAAGVRALRCYIVQRRQSLPKNLQRRRLAVAGDNNIYNAYTDVIQGPPDRRARITC